VTYKKKLKLSDVNILQICCKLEETCAEMYRYFAQLYADSPDASDLWTKTAQEEDSHAEQFRLACRLYGSSMKALNTDKDRVQKILTNIQSIFDFVKKSPPKLNDALRYAIRMENSLAEYHMNNIVEFEDENLARLFTSMRKNDLEHTQMLERAYEAMCSKTNPE
jgi:rubrerythrin